MRPNFRILNNRAKSLLRGTSLLAGIGAAFVATAPAFAADADSTIETVVVTGYRASLTAATDAKRASTNFTDSIFAEDIGKFPDSNIAESLNRIPGVSISREIDGEGVNVSIRGLGTNFTKILLNGAQVAVASTGSTDSQNTNREVDLNMFPTELFTQLTVSKTPTANLVEGGAAGTVNMRSARPFDNPDAHITYTVQGTDYSNADSLGARGAIIASDTWGPFGILVGAAGVHSNVQTTGFETIGWTNPNLTAAQCSGSCNTTGGGNWTIPATVPANVDNGLVTGAVIDQAFLLAHNPGLTISQIDNGLIPRLGRPSFEAGTRDRYNGVVSLEYRPSDDLHFYIDMVGGRSFNNLNRIDMNWVGRNGAFIPLNEHVDSNNVVTGATFANAQFFLEARPYKETTDFVSINPGGEWQVNELLHLSLQGNWSESHFYRQSPTILVITAPSAGNATGVPGATPPVGGVTVTYSNPTGASAPTISSNLDLNNPANFQWNGGRVNIQDERRYTYTRGVHFDGGYGGDEMKVSFGAAYDNVHRDIRAYDNSQAWQNAVCGDNPSQFLPGPNTQPPCLGLNVVAPPGTTGAAATALNTALTPGTTSFPVYPGYGTGYSASLPPLSYAGSLIPQSALASYLLPGPTGFITVNYPKFFADSHYDAFNASAPFATSSNTSANSGTVDEKVLGLYAELNGVLHLDTRNLRYDLGLRWAQTEQTISGPVTIADPRNAVLPASADGARFPSTFPFATTKHTYGSFLPSLNVVYEVADDVQLRASVSRTMTRPNPNAMLPGLNFSSPSADTATIGNPALAPFYSNNIDVGAEVYTGNEGYFGVAVFRKSLSGFTVTGTSTVPFSSLAAFGVTYNTLTPTQQTAIDSRGGPAAANITLSQQVNASGLLTVNGIEFDWVQPLDFLTEGWFGFKGLGFTANLTVLDQKGSGAAPALATGISPYSYNLTGYYEQNGLMVRVSYVFNDKTLASGSNQNGICLPNTGVSTCPGGAYLYGSPYRQLDLSTSYKLSNLLGPIPSDPEITFDAQNLTGSHLHSFFQFSNATFTDYNQGSVYMFGIRGTF